MGGPVPRRRAAMQAGPEARIARGRAAPLRARLAVLRVRARRFRVADEAVAAIEFGLILPILLAIMLGGTQLVLYINASRKVDLIARSVSQMISQAMPPASGGVALVNATDVHFSFDAALVLFPSLMKGFQYKGGNWFQNISINYAGITFSPTSSTCTNSADMSACYTANVVWTSSGIWWGPAAFGYRPCTPAQVAADNTAAPSPTTLPRSVYGPASLVVIDVVFTFTPSFGARFIGPVRIARSAYVQPRYATLVNYDTTNNDGIASRCPGY